jgi:hypothetical protein
MDFLVRQDNLHECRSVGSPAAPLEAGQARLAIDAFGLTSNNITYGVLGDGMSYWSFFPAAEEGWGRIPVWGFADVVESEDGVLEDGTRVFGYLPPSSTVVVTPGRVNERGFVDASPHRAELPAAYNSYTRVDADPGYSPEHEGLQMLLRPLYFTSFLIDDWLDDEGFFGASSVVLSSASSKTAIGTAFLLSRREGLDVVGLTSPGNAEFVEGLAIYDRVIPYDAVESLAQEPTVYVDISGDAGVRAAVHGRLGEALRHSSWVGGTHWDQLDAGGQALPGPEPKVFFAPDRVAKRARDWGEGLEQRLAGAWSPLVEWTAGWLEVTHGRGPAAVEQAYLELLEGRTDPARGHVLSMAD